MQNKKYDVVVYGASGFTGKFVAKHLYEVQKSVKEGKLKGVEDDFTFAIAGRSESKLKGKV